MSCVASSSTIIINNNNNNHTSVGSCKRKGNSFTTHTPINPKVKKDSTFTLPIFTTTTTMASSKNPKQKLNRSDNKNHKTTSRQRKTTKQEKAVTALPDIEDMFSSDETHRIRASLLDWYDKKQRDLPWRKNPKSEALEEQKEEEEEEREKRAYGVWVSEVMLQQTRVQTVIDYYNRWMLKWPTLHHLSQASLEEVNGMWAGLGYYRRARFLLEGAKMIVGSGAGFPNKVSSLRKVPGIGDYTAGAIASIAFREVAPAVDGNVTRVLSRLKAISANPKDKVTVKNFWKLAAQLVDPYRPGDFNQSLMELGATVCSLLNPSCSSCPVSGHCRAFAASIQDKSILVTDYPTKIVKAKQRHEFAAVCVVEVLGSQEPTEGSQSVSGFLLVKRPDEGLLAGLWEFPSVTLRKEADMTTRRKEADSFLKKTFGINPPRTCSIVYREDVGEFVHIFTHIRLKLYVELLVLRLKGVMTDLTNKLDKETKCVDEKTLSSLGLTSAVRKVYTMVQKFKQDRLHNLGSDSVVSVKRVNSKRRRPY